MAIDYKTPTQIADQYLTLLKNLKPEVNTAQTDSDWWVRSRVVGGIFAGVYADQRKIADDAFPQSARHDALANHLQLYFGEGFKAASPALGNLLVSGATGTTIPVGQQFQYGPNGNLYAATTAVTLTLAPTGVVPVQSVVTGQDQNLLLAATLSVLQPPIGLGTTATVYGANMSDGRNDETDPEAAARILTQIRQPLAGGKVADYQQFALSADSTVVSASVIRFPFGFGTVGVIITAGTNDIDTALDTGIPITLIPSDALVAKVQAYIETQNPVTDCATVLKPASTTQDVSVVVRLFQGTLDTILTGQTLTQRGLIQREVQRAIYKTPAGGRVFGASGYVVCSEIEEMLDLNLGAEPYATGNKAQILLDRQVGNLSASGPNRGLLGYEIAFPGTITVTEF